VLAEDASADWLFIIEQGKLALEKKIQFGRRGTVRMATIGVVGPGKSVGWSALTPPHIYTSAAMCLEPARVIALDAQALRRFLSDNPRVGYKVMTVIAGLARARYRAPRIRWPISYRSSRTSCARRSPRSKTIST